MRGARMGRGTVSDDAMDADDVLTCRDAALLVCDARDRALVPAEASYLGRHLSTCAECRSAARQFASLFAQMDALFAVDKPSA